MHVTYVGCVVVYVILADIIVISLAAGPSWDQPVSTTITLDSTTADVCDDVTTLTASSTDGATVVYSISSQTPDGGFSMFQSQITFNYHLTCMIGSINAEPYTVVVSARHDGGNNEETLLTLTIDFSVPAPATGPTWTSGTSYSIDKAVNTACDSVVTLSATSTDSSSVTYSFQSESPAGGGFSVSGSILECDIGSVAATTYTVVVRAQNTGNNEVTDETFTITVTASSSGGSGSGSDSNSGRRDDGWKYGVGFGVAFALSAAIAVGAYVVYKVLIQKKKNKVKQEKNKNDLKKNDRSDDVKNMQWQHKTS